MRKSCTKKNAYRFFIWHSPNWIARITNRVYQGRLLLAFQSIAPGDYFEFTPDCVLNGDYRVHLKDK
jgi:hypothetical protein